MSQVRVKIAINADNPEGAVYETAATQCDETVFDALSSALAQSVAHLAQHLEGSPGVYVLMADVIESLAAADAQGCTEGDMAVWVRERMLLRVASELLEHSEKEVVHATDGAPAATA